MKKTNCLFTLWAAAICVAGSAHAVGTAPAIFSQYGEIQSVKKYSSNPFWNKDSPYNQNFPKPIYATGADLNTGDCNRVVENLVTSYCAEHNYCTNLRISDVRPTIMVQLSQLPGHNFATSCGGYIDSAFENFQKTYGNTSTVNLPKTGSQTTNIEIANPFAPKQTAQQKAVAERTAELERLQSITTPTPAIGAAAFPTTTADLSFTDRVANTAAGYEQYKNMPSYRTPTFHDEDEAFFEKLKAQNFEKYCERRPTDPECKDWYCKKHPDDDQCKKTTPTTPVTPPVNPPITPPVNPPITPPVNPPITPPNTNCPDTHMTVNPTTGKCECTGKYAPKPGAPNTCICANGADIADDCVIPDEMYFMFWDCRGYPAHHENLINTRNSGDTGVSIRAANCSVRPGRGSTHNCIGMTTNPGEGIINRLFEAKISKKIGRRDESLYVLSNIDTAKYDFSISESDIDNFINQLVVDKDAVKNECTSNSRAWRLFIDKHIISGGTHTYKPYKTICIGGQCTPGEIKTH